MLIIRYLFRHASNCYGNHYTTFYNQGQAEHVYFPGNILNKYIQQWKDRFLLDVAVLPSSELTVGEDLELAQKMTLRPLLSRMHMLRYFKQCLWKSGALRIYIPNTVQLGDA